MLLGTHPHSTDFESTYGSVHNYYERLVFDQIANTHTKTTDPNFVADVACVALNHLPPRYVRHDVDMTFFLSREELEEIYNKVAKAVDEAIKYVDARNQTKERQS